MVHWERLVTAVGGRRLILALGGMYIAVAIARALIWLDRGGEISSFVLVSLFIGGAGLILLYGGYRLPRTDIRPEFYPTVAGWCLSGLVIMFSILGLYHLIAVGGIANPDRAIPILTALSGAAGFGVGFHDAQTKTRSRELEETVERLRTSNERLEQFAYAASHDMQEPLRMVSSYLQLVDQRYSDELDEDGREFIEFAVDGADRMQKMIEGLLAYSRVDTRGEPLEPTDLNAVLDDVLADMQLKIEESEADITTDSLPRVEGDEVQLYQLFQNLLENAIEYSGDESPRIHITADQNNSSRIVSVRDEGVGIDPSDHERIFDVFQRLHSREGHAGSGIGLALCERILERHRGEIWVESEPGAGSTFRFSLPTPNGTHV